MLIFDENRRRGKLFRCFQTCELFKITDFSRVKIQEIFIWIIWYYLDYLIYLFIHLKRKVYLEIEQKPYLLIAVSNKQGN